MKRTIVLLVALVAGMLIGGFLHPYFETPWLKSLIVDWVGLVGQVFLRLIFMIVVPMIVSALILGVFELGCERGIGRVFGKTVACTVIASGASVLIGVTLVNVLRPGDGVHLKVEQSAELTAIEKNAAEAKPLSQTLLDLIPKNPVDAAARALDGEIISLMVGCLIFGAAMSMAGVREKVRATLVPFLEQVFAVSMKVVGFAMVLAPAGVFSLVMVAGFKHGFGVFANLMAYVGVVVLALLIQQFVVYSLMLRLGAGRSPWKFYRDCREVYLYAFSTSSSNATLPKSLETAETTLGIPKRIARFVLTVGATANQNGTALFEGITVLFLAQVYHVELTMSQQLTVVFMSILAGIGTAGVPGGSLPLIVILMQSVGVPADGIGLVLGVDRFLDMCRTTLNVSGDLVIAAVVGRGEPESAPAAAGA